MAGINEEDVNMEAPDSSTEAADAVEDSATIADSSPADEEGDSLDAGSLVQDVIEGVVGEREASPAADSEEQGTETDNVEGQQEADDSDLDEESFKNEPFAKHPRFRQLLKQKRELKAQCEQLRGSAQRYDNVQNFLNKNEINAEEAASALIIAGQIKSNPAKAWELLQPIVTTLLQQTGQIIPADLQQRVQAGELQSEMASEMSRLRAQAENAQRAQAAERQRATVQRAHNQATMLATTADQWAEERRQRDPHFAAKEPVLKDAVAGIIMAEGRPSTREGVLSVLKRAYETTNARFTPPAAPQQRPAQRTSRVALSSTNTSGSAGAATRSTMDIIKDQVARRGR